MVPAKYMAKLMVQNAALKCSFSDYLTSMGVLFILLLMVHRYIYIYGLPTTVVDDFIYLF